ncbi:MAG: hypothetical protein KF730_08900 [Sphingomonas sp.]|uniref:hypothetical protein n=1 Tax=Sphingomonas sp. TaxID=28214 RepID=UPI0025F5A653|nr:hypothetical protein [Sphingomonas sp.]MBX3564679.1 hypothetical protein [Sphingomonas sp.]
MIWDARKIDDMTYHRRRAVLGGLGVLMTLYLLAERFADHGLELGTLRWLVITANLGMLVFFGRMLINELIEMRRHG